MAKQDKETYDSYEKDVYDNPPAGPMGVHRGARSAASRAMPYVIVIIVALLAGLLFWSIYSGEINNLKMPWSSQESSTTSSAEKSKSGEPFLLSLPHSIMFPCLIIVPAHNPV